MSLPTSFSAALPLERLVRAAHEYHRGRHPLRLRLTISHLLEHRQANGSVSESAVLHLITPNSVWDALVEVGERARQD